MHDALEPAHRRPLHFDRIDQVLEDVVGLAAAEAAGTLRSAGAWSLGQSLNHMAQWVDYGYDGIPMKIPLPVRWVMRLMKNRMLYKPMRAGVRIPGTPGGTLAIEPTPLSDGLVHFRRSFTRLRDESPPPRHVGFGPMSHDQWIALNLRHAELHLSFFTTTGRK